MLPSALLKHYYNDIKIYLRVSYNSHGVSGTHAIYPLGQSARISVKCVRADPATTYQPWEVILKTIVRGISSGGGSLIFIELRACMTASSIL